MTEQLRPLSDQEQTIAPRIRIVKIVQIGASTREGDQGERPVAIVRYIPYFLKGTGTEWNRTFGLPKDGRVRANSAWGQFLKSLTGCGHTPTTIQGFWVEWEETDMTFGQFTSQGVPIVTTVFESEAAAEAAALGMGESAAPPQIAPGIPANIIEQARLFWQGCAGNETAFRSIMGEMFKLSEVDLGNLILDMKRG